MIDPITAAVAAAGYGLANSIGPRLIQKLIPTPFDKAQIASIETQRLRLQSDEARFERQLEEARERLLNEHRQRRELLEYQEQLKHWPHSVLPMDFINRSGEANGRSLNIILRQSDHRQSAAGGSNQDISVRILNRAILIAEDQMIDWYSNQQLANNRVSDSVNGVLFYPSYKLTAPEDIQSTTTTLSSLMRTEPTILLQIAVCGNLVYRLAISHWGEAFGDTSKAIALSPILINLSSLASDEQSAQRTLSMVLTTVIVSMADTFHLLRRPHDLAVPAIYNLMKLSQSLDHAKVYWEPIVKTYRTGLKHVADHAPLLASELAANTALVAAKAGQTEQSVLFLQDAVHFFCVATSFQGDEQQLLNRINSNHPTATEKLKLQQALIEIRRLSPEPVVNRRSLDEVLSSLGPTH